jgi:TfoX/Sxy family transcriptional regulator of competence genes
MYHSGPLFSLQYADRLLIQIDVSLIEKLKPKQKTKNKKKKKIKQFRHPYYGVVFKAWIFFRRAARKKN